MAAMVEHWISSGEAFDLVTQRYDQSGRYADLAVCRAVAEDALLKRLSNTVLRARARKGQLRSGDPFGSMDEADFDDAHVPASFWRNLRLSEDADREIDWVLGDFSFALGHNEHCVSGEAFGVFFEVAGIPGGIHTPQLESSSQPFAQQGAGRPPKYDWVSAALAIFGLIHRGDLKPDCQADIELALIKHLKVGDSAPGESTVRPYAKLIWEESLKA